MCRISPLLFAALCAALASSPLFAQVGKRFPSEKKVVPDPVTGVPLTFLTTGPSSDAKLYQTHQPWTSDGNWIIFRSSNRVPGNAGQAFAVNEASGIIVQLTEGPYSCTSALNVARKSMKLYYTRTFSDNAPAAEALPDAAPAPGAGRGRAGRGAGGGGGGGGGGRGAGGQVHLYELDLATLFADSEAGAMKPTPAYERLCGVLPPGLRESGGFGLDANEDFAYIGVSGGDVGQHLPPDLKVAPLPGNVRMGAGPGGLRSMNLKTGEVKTIIDVPFQMGHVQTNQWVPGEIIYCWETGGKAPQRTWTIMADGSGNRPLYKEADYEWITHEAVITKDEVAIALMGHVQRPNAAAGPYAEAGMRTHPTGLGVVNLRTGLMRIEAQTPTGSGLWHVNGSYDGRWLVGDDFTRSDYLIDRHTHEMLLWTTGHKETAADHTHPIFSPDGTRILIQSAMLAPDNRSLDLCVVPIPKSWLARTYTDKAPE
jgi:oligogalacturonide lyase